MPSDRRRLTAISCVMYGLRRHSDGRVAAAARSAVLGLTFFPLVRFYRLLLFFVTLHTMH